MIIPPSTFLADERVFPFLGPLKVAAELRRNGNPVDLLDLSGYADFEYIVSHYATHTPVRTFGITATTPQIPAAVKTLQQIKRIIPEASVILGGPHLTLTHAAMIQDAKAHRSGRGTKAFIQLQNLFDRLVVGDGELAVFDAIDPAVHDQTIDAGHMGSRFFLQRGGLDDFPFPARDLIDLETYHYTIEGRRAFSVIAQLGCPFECGFCGGRDAQTFRVTRSRSIHNVIDEIQHVVQDSIARGNPYKAVMFYDDELNVMPSNLEDLCRCLIDMQDRLGIDMRFRGFIKAELFTEDQARLMALAGFSVVLSGVESGSDDILSTMRKHTSRAINSRCVELAHGAGLKFKALMSIGHPGESERTVAESGDWVLQSRPDDVDWTIITEYPGAPYFDRSAYVAELDAWLYTEPRTGNRLWSRAVDYSTEAEYYKGIPGDYTAYVWTDTLSSERLVELRDQAEHVTKAALGLGPIVAAAPMQFEHSMGQDHRRLPPGILRSTWPG